jgi:3-hydroxyacyl-CoA dehydrogenase/3a,7a,12a-trihydroxy-5b-cholest-24-enoyl-CoA hydratase
MTMRFDDRVVIITGAGQGLGRSHALQFAARGARVVVNDLGGTRTGEGADPAPADQVVEEIVAAGGEAVASHDSVTRGERVVQCALDNFGRVDAVVHNAGILRDRAFHNMTHDDWDQVYEVHLKGAFRVTHAAWPCLREQTFGRIVFTSSAAGLYGNFGQANYAMAKMGLVGFCQSLAQEGRRYGILANTIAPVADSRLTADVMPEELRARLQPEQVSPLVLKLAHESHDETGGLFEAGAGMIARVRWERARGHAFPASETITPEAIDAHWKAIADFSEPDHPADAQSALNGLLTRVRDD